MKITAIDHWLVSIPYREQVAFSSTTRNNATRLIVRLETDAGVVGWGETLCLLDFVEPVLRNVVIPTALGLNVHEFERLIRLVEASGYYHHQRAGVMATSAVEMAMWDAYGKTLGVPCHLLWGGRFRDRVEIAAYTMAGDIGVFERHLKAMIERNYQSYKIKVGFSEDLDLEMIRLARRLVGTRKLRADVNSVWTQATARRILAKVADCDLQYIEQPLPVYDLAGHAELRQVQSVPVALDESAYTTGDVGAIIGARAADVMLLDPSQAGGLWEVRKQAAAAEAACLAVGLHSGGEMGPSLAAYLHLAAATPNMWIALDWSGEHMSDTILKDFQHLPTDGYLPVPAGPGLGIEVDISKIERYAVTAIPFSYRPPEQTDGRIPIKPYY
ncbi:MAG TPA: mandelate racemase/muconate lactonizing enzyme family protein [Devosia sp.]|nr:mandelate racemase/muconate lactonizing enzyme family protein [Devosia sp.]